MHTIRDSCLGSNFVENDDYRRKAGVLKVLNNEIVALAKIR